MPSHRHEGLIDQLCGEGWSREPRWCDAFKLAISEEPFCGEDGMDADLLPKLFKQARIKPDAYRFVVEGPEEGHWAHPVLVVELAEVVVTHPVPHTKLDVIEDLWWYCDATEYVHLRLYTIDRYGEKKCVLDEYPVVSG